MSNMSTCAGRCGSLSARGRYELSLKKIIKLNCLVCSSSLLVDRAFRPYVKVDGVDQFAWDLRGTQEDWENGRNTGWTLLRDLILWRRYGSC